MSGRAGGALAARPTDRESEKGRVDQTRVKRYWAGKAPDWAADGAQGVADLQLGDREAVRTEIAAPTIVRKADPRLSRLAANRGQDLEEVRERHREIRAAEIVRRRRVSDDEEEGQEKDQGRRGRGKAGGDEPGSDTAEDERPGAGGESSDEGEKEEAPRLRHTLPVPEEDEEEILQRRQAVRERLIQQQKAAESLLAEQQQQQQQAQEEEEEEEDSSEFETDSDEEPEYGRRLLKPVFVPKESRETIAEREKMELEEQEAIEREKQRALERKAETRQLVAERVAADALAAKAASEAVNDDGALNASDIDTDDEGDQVEEFEAWKVRELARIKTVRDEREKQEREAIERERLKNMTDEERAAWERANPKEGKPDEKKKWRFMQKYWHKGAYYQEAPDDARGTTAKDDIFTRDYSAPTGEDTFNKEILPKVMQVRNFGRAGRTKWTHLLAEDTTNFEDPLALPTTDKRRPISSSANEFSKPKKFKQ